MGKPVKAILLHHALNKIDVWSDTQGTETSKYLEEK